VQVSEARLIELFAVFFRHALPQIFEAFGWPVETAPHAHSSLWRFQTEELNNKEPIPPCS
jgi:hypothetical protein